MVIMRLYTEVFLMYMHGYCGYQWLLWLSVAICMVIVVISGYCGYQWLVYSCLAKPDPLCGSGSGLQD